MFVEVFIWGKFVTAGEVCCGFCMERFAKVAAKKIPQVFEKLEFGSSNERHAQSVERSLPFLKGG